MKLLPKKKVKILDDKQKDEKENQKKIYRNVQKVLEIINQNKKSKEEDGEER